MIQNQIGNLNYHLLMGFLEAKNIYPTEDEAIVMTNFIKENYQEILARKTEPLMELKGKIRNTIYIDTTNVFLTLKKQYF